MDRDEARKSLKHIIKSYTNEGTKTLDRTAEIIERMILEVVAEIKNDERKKFEGPWTDLLKEFAKCEPVIRCFRNGDSVAICCLDVTLEGKFADFDGRWLKMTVVDTSGSDGADVIAHRMLKSLGLHYTESATATSSTIFVRKLGALGA